MKKLLEAIEDIKGTGSFCTSGNLEQCLPGIEIKNYGHLSLPISTSDLKKIKKHFSAAPFGKGTKTIVDKEIRNTKELDPKHFTISNPGWNSNLKKNMNKIATELGLDKSNISFSLYKMLLYTEGDFFLPHRDTEKEDNMFATLVVSLPSKYEGGELVINHEDKKRVFSSNSKTQYEFSYIAFYADCKHEIKKVTSGSRICLIYNLTLSSKKKQPLAPKLSNYIDRVSLALKNSKMTSDKIAILLEHQYTEKSFSNKSLKNSDIMKAQVLFNAAKSQGYIAHLALFTLNQLHEFEGGSFDNSYHDWYEDEDEEDEEVDEGSIGDLIDTTQNIDNWFDSKGKKVNFGEMNLDDVEVLSYIDLSKIKPDEEDKEEYTGNAGATIDRWYRRAAIVLWKKDNHFKVLAKNMRLDSLLELLYEYVKAKKNKSVTVDLTKENLKDFAFEIIENWDSGEYRYNSDNSSKLNQTMLKSLSLLGDIEIIIKFFQKKLSLMYNGEDAKLIKKTMDDYGWNSFKNELSIFINPKLDKTKLDFPKILFTLTESIDKDSTKKKICLELAEKFFNTCKEIDKMKNDDYEIWRDGKEITSKASSMIAFTIKAFLNLRDD